MFIDIVLEDEPNDRRFVASDLATSLFVKEISELHRLIPTSLTLLAMSR